jgi:hypothetical protein
MRTQVAGWAGTPHEAVHVLPDGPLSRSYALFRNDLPFEPEVAQVDRAEISNIFRLMNHDCEPNSNSRA